MMILDSGLLFWATLYMKLYSHRNAANNRHIIKHREKIYTKIWR